MSYHIILVNNYFNNHTIGLVDEFYKETNGNFLALETTELEEFRKKIGWKPVVREYIDKYQNHVDDVLNADVVIYGGSGIDTTLNKRIQSNKLTFFVTERPYKIPTTKVTYIKRLVGSYLHFGRYQKDNLYLLAQGGYVKEDMKLFHNFKGRILKWGYFPIMQECQNIRKEIPQITWCGRMLSWKHPELAIKLAKYLIELGIPFHMDIIGSGDLYDEIKKEADTLKEYISITPSISNDDMQKKLDETDLLLVTSDRYEGWGAIVNEGMYHKCIVLSNNLVGSSTYLIQDKQNGFIYTNEAEFLNKGYYILNHLDEMDSLREKAHNTIKLDWNYTMAVKRMLEWSNAYLKNESHSFTDGIMSGDNY
jgi:glycosyltransferase involved in cell wall biosynthesis